MACYGALYEILLGLAKSTDHPSILRDPRLRLQDLQLQFSLLATDRAPKDQMNMRILQTFGFLCSSKFEGDFR